MAVKPTSTVKWHLSQPKRSGSLSRGTRFSHSGLGCATDVPFIADLMLVSSQPVSSFTGGNSPGFYAISDMAAMAAAEVTGESPQAAGMELVGDGIYCPFAKAADIFGVTGDRPAFIKRFLEQMNMSDEQ